LTVFGVDKARQISEWAVRAAANQLLLRVVERISVSGQRRFRLERLLDEAAVVLGRRTCVLWA
jgi:predicted amino acid racemase